MRFKCLASLGEKRILVSVAHLGGERKWEKGEGRGISKALVLLPLGLKNQTSQGFMLWVVLFSFPKQQKLPVALPPGSVIPSLYHSLRGGEGGSLPYNTCMLQLPLPLYG